nr:UvrD-helicase domain-containing protein [Rhodovibrio sodomensis]
MGDAVTDTLIDQEARTRALTDASSTLLVEAGAGTGKTAIMAGRLVKLLADGTDPENIAAITFTELAAGELQQRVARFVDRVIAGDMPVQIASAFPGGPSAQQVAALREARGKLDRLTCTTIHGWCKQMIGPYPVETGMDPGAKMIDPANADLIFQDIKERWLREHLSGAAAEDGESAGDDLLAQMLLADPDHALRKIDEAADQLRGNRTAGAPAAELTRADLADLEAAVDEFVELAGRASEPSVDQIAEEFGALRDSLIAALQSGPDAAGLLACAEPMRISRMLQGKVALKKWDKKGVYVKAASGRGASKAEAERLNDEAQAAYDRVSGALEAFAEKAARVLNHRFMQAMQTLVERYEAYKSDAALMDFDDLLFGARALLRDHPEVRDALARRYRVVLVDEFQDTDPVQAEILWRLCEAEPRQPADRPWTDRQPEPGRLFLVGDPKQAIYRFRGADVGCYMQARSALHASAGDQVSIQANFRSQQGLIEWVNGTFDAALSAEDQPGFEALSWTKADGSNEARVRALDVPVEASNPDKGSSVDDMRRAEAASIADLCRRLVDSYTVLDEDATGGERPCRPGDIALIAPAGTSLWIYESALENAGLPIATQAGKGAFRRQEILDLIAVTRTLADTRDTLALGALLRGPLVGATEEQLLDCVAALPRDPDRPDRIPVLNLNADPDVLPNETVKHVLHVLRGLRKRAAYVTPFELLAEAVEELRVRPILEQRHPRSAERALSNVDLFLELARPYAVRGLKAFASDMRKKWEASTSQAEGRPDAQEQAVQVITMHSAKGLEWPVVIPVNAMGEPMGQNGPQLRRSDNTLHLHLTKTGPRTEAHEAAKAENEAAVAAERARLWYVTCTRAKQLLVLPRLEAPVADGAWINLVDLGLPELDALDPQQWPSEVGSRETAERNEQDAATFAAEAGRVACAHPVIRRRTPSRHEAEQGDAAGSSVADAPQVFAEIDGPTVAGAGVAGSPTRGLVIHKLLEEVLTGELDEADVECRAGVLLQELGVDPAPDPADGPCGREMAEVVARALALGEVASRRSQLIPETTVQASTVSDAGEEIVSGLADAVSVDPSGAIEAVIDWKSDVAADPGQRTRYREQMRDYLKALGCETGLLVYVTDGTVERVTPA